MEEDLLSARFDKLLKRYQEKLDRLQLDLPESPEAPAVEPAPAEPPRREAELPSPQALEPVAQQPAPEEPLPQAQAPAAPLEEPPEPLPSAQPESRPGPEMPAWPAPEFREASRPPEPRPTPIREEPAAVRETPLPSLPREDDVHPAQETPAKRAEAPAPSPDRPRDRSAWLFGLALAAAAATFWWGYHSLEDKPAYRTFSLSGTAARGLTWREGRLAAVDAENQSLLLFDLDAKSIRSTERFSNQAPVGLDWADGAFWSTEKDRSAIFQHDGGAEHGVRRIYATPNRLPAALAGDNEDIWAADAKSAVLYRYLIGHSLNGTSLTPLNQYNLPGAPAAGLYDANGLLWVLDAQDRRLTRYSYDAGTLSAVDAADLAARLPAGAAVSGMVVGGDFLWVLTAEPAVLHRFSLRELRWAPAGAR